MNYSLFIYGAKRQWSPASGGQHVTDQPNNKTYHPSSARASSTAGNASSVLLTRTKFDDAVTRVTFVFEKINKQTRLLLSK